MSAISATVSTGQTAADRAQQTSVEQAFATMVNSSLDPASQSFMMLRVRPDGTFAMPPSMPGALSVANAANGAHTLTWGASTDADPVSGYIVLRDGTEVARVGPNATTWTDTTNGIHDWEVRAYDVNGAVSQGTTDPLATQTAEAQAQAAQAQASAPKTSSTGTVSTTAPAPQDTSTASTAVAAPQSASSSDTSTATPATAGQSTAQQ